MTDSESTTHENKQKNGTETDEQRKERTGLSSLQMGEDEAAKAAKTEDRVALSRMQKKVVGEEFWHPASIPHMTVCVLTLENGFALVGKASPASAENFNEDLGRKFAYEDAMRQLWPLEGYLLRQYLHQQEHPESDSGEGK